jgi:hypothetical protein
MEWVNGDGNGVYERTSLSGTVLISFREDHRGKTQERKEVVKELVSTGTKEIAFDRPASLSWIVRSGRLCFHTQGLRGSGRMDKIAGLPNCLCIFELTSWTESSISTRMSAPPLASAAD